MLVFILPTKSRNVLNFGKNGGFISLVYLRIVHILIGRLLDLCIKFFQEFVPWEISQNERKPEDYLSADDLFYAVNNCLNQVDDEITYLIQTILLINSLPILICYYLNGS